MGYMKEGVLNSAYSTGVARGFIGHLIDENDSVPPMEFARFVGIPAQAIKESHCPFCGSIIYSKRHKNCGVCGVELPESCLFSFNQARRVEKTLAEERGRYRAWVRKSLWQ